jgi:hypothetical protein
MYPRHWSRWHDPVIVPCAELRITSPVTLSDVSGVVGGVRGTAGGCIIPATIALLTPGALFKVVELLGIGTLLSVPVKFACGLLILWATGERAISSLSVKCSRQLVRSKRTYQGSFSWALGWRAKVRGEGAKPQSQGKVWKETGDGAKAHKQSNTGSRRGGEESDLDVIDEMVEEWIAGKMWLWFGEIDEESSF